MFGQEIEVRKYSKEDLYKVVEEIKGDLPLELTFSEDGDVDVVEINSSGWVTYKTLDEEKIKKIRVKDLADELVNHNHDLVDYVLKKK